VWREVCCFSFLDDDDDFFPWTSLSSSWLLEWIQHCGVEAYSLLEPALCSSLGIDENNREQIVEAKMLQQKQEHVESWPYFTTNITPPSRIPPQR
jgi:hypothetical protein